MVATLAPVASTDAAELYYLDNQASVRPKAEYYAVGKEPDGVWLNPAGLFALPDRARVTTADFHKLFWGFSPIDGAKLSRNAGSEARSAAIDITFSADKSVSALWAIADPHLREEIQRAHNDAARESYEAWMLGECAYTRRTGSDGNLEVVPAELIAAMFQHGENREQDPQLHTHVVCFNIAYTRDDRKYRTHHQHPAFMWTKTLGAWYRAALAWNLQERLGIRMEQYGPNNEFSRIAGMPEELVQSWSKRTGQIHAWAKAQGVRISDNPALARAATLNTRKHKNNLGDRAEDFERWADHADKLVPGIRNLVASLLKQHIEIGSDDIRRLLEHLRTVPEHLMRAEAVTRLPAIVTEITNRSATVLRPAAIKTALARVLLDPALVELKPRPTLDSTARLRHTEVFTTKHTLLMEKTVTALAKSMQRATGYGIDRAAVDTKIAALKAESYPVSDEQIDAIRAAATSDGRIAVIEGAAGSGKTTTLRPLADLWRDAGKNIIATAVPWRTATALGTDVDAPMFSVAKLLSMAARDQLDVDHRSIIIADEAGMLSTREIHHLMQLSEKTGAKIVFCGDTQQQQPVEAGPGLRLVRHVVGSSRIAMIRRQKADIEDVLRHRHGISPEEARAEAETMTKAEREAILAEFEASPQATDRPFTPWQIAASQDFRDGQTTDAITAYRDRGRFHLCRNIDATIEKIAADVARYTEENPGKTVAVMARTNAERRALSLALRRHALGDQPRNRHVIEVSDREDGRRRVPLEIAEGDRLRIGATHWKKQLFNGSVVIVDDLELSESRGHQDTRLHINGHTDDGRAVSFNHDEIRDYYGNIRLEHGYALTITSAQGLTVDAAFLLADSRSARETIYPAATRHRERLDIYVDRNAAAHEAAHRRIVSDKDDQVVTDDQIVEHLANSWKRSSPKQAAHDYRVRRRRAPQPDGPDLDPTPGEAPEIGRRVREDREQVLELRYGNTIAALASGRREVLQSYDAFRARAAAGENVADQPAFRATLRRHAVLVTAAEPFRTHPRKFAGLLKRRGGLTTEDLQDFRHRLKRARNFSRGQAISKTMAGRPRPPSQRRASTSRRIDPRKPLPDRLLESIERDLKALAPDGPRPSQSVTTVSAASDVSLDVTTEVPIAAPPEPDPERHTHAPAPTGDEERSPEDLENYAESIERSAAIPAPNAGTEMPEDPGWAEYAASLDAQADPGGGADPQTLSEPRAPHSTAPADVPSAPAAPAPTAADRYRAFMADFLAHRRQCQALRTSPWADTAFRPYGVHILRLLRDPDLPPGQRAALEDIRDRAREYANAPADVRLHLADLNRHAQDFGRMRAVTADTGTPLDSLPEYAGWRARGDRLTQYRARATRGVTNWLADTPDIRERYAAHHDRLTANLRVAGEIVQVGAEFEDFRRRRDALIHNERDRGIGPTRSPGYAALQRTARALVTRPHLPEPQRAELRNFLDRARLRHITRQLGAHATENIHRQLSRSVTDLTTRNTAIRIAEDLARHLRALPAREHPVVDGRHLHYAETPKYRDWAATAETLLRRARRDAASAFSRSADPAPPLPAAIRRSSEALQGILEHNRTCHRADEILDDLHTQWLALGHQAHDDGLTWIDHRDTPHLMRRAELIAERDDAGPSIHSEIAQFRAQHDAEVDRRKHLNSIAARLDAHLGSREAIRQDASAQRLHAVEHPDYEAWRLGVDGLKKAVHDIFEDPENTYRRHLKADPTLEIRIRGALENLVLIRDQDALLARALPPPQSPEPKRAVLPEPVRPPTPEPTRDPEPDNARTPDIPPDPHRGPRTGF